jgi:hypothetical protein
MLWEVAKREDFITNADFGLNPDELGSTLLLVHTFLSPDFLDSLDSLPGVSLYALAWALGSWHKNVKSKGKETET